LSELLERAHARARADDGDEIVGRDVLVDVLAHRALGEHQVGGRQLEIVDDDGDGAAHLFAAEAARRRRRRVLIRARGARRRRRRGALGLDVGEVRDLLRPAVLEDLEVFGLQIGDLLAVLVRDDQIELHEVRRDPHDITFVDFGGRRRRRLRRTLGGGLGRRGWRGRGLLLRPR
jgi:hypothetical protein